MRKNTALIMVGIVTILSGTVFAATTARALFYSPETEVITPPSNIRTTPATVDEYPSKISIPKLDVTAHIQHVGMNTNGNMASPTNYQDVGWYRHGTPPGYRGSSVIAGHLDNGLALDGVFKHLNQLTEGDDIYITTAGGNTLHFEVVEVRTYPYREVPTEMIFNASDTVRLNLITCGGDWLKAEKTYSERVVVYTTLVDTE